MSRLAELRNRGTATRIDEKKSISLETELTKLTEGAFVSSVSPISRSMNFFSQSATVQPPAPADRLCYQCASFQRSSYGYPLGLCQQHGNRVQHSTSRPTSFGCGGFVLRDAADDNRTCLACRHYSQQSTMCSMVNTGCPYPAIPPCIGTKFQQGKLAAGGEV